MTLPLNNVQTATMNQTHGSMFGNIAQHPTGRPDAEAAHVVHAALLPGTLGEERRKGFVATKAPGGQRAGGT